MEIVKNELNSETEKFSFSWESLRFIFPKKKERRKFLPLRVFGVCMCVGHRVYEREKNENVGGNYNKNEYKLLHLICKQKRNKVTKTLVPR